MLSWTLQVTTGDDIMREEYINFLINTGAPAAYLAMADVYIKMYLRMPYKFVLPKAHKDVLYLIEEFAYDLEGFVKFSKDVRDRLRDVDGSAAIDVHDIYRTLYTRMIQQQRRQRSARAIELIAEHLGPPNPNERLTWQRAIEKYWAEQRTGFAAEARRRHSKHKLSREELNSLYDEFWYQLDKRLNDGFIDAELLRYIDEHRTDDT